MEGARQKRPRRIGVEMPPQPFGMGDQVIFRDSAPRLPLVSRIVFGTTFDVTRIYGVDTVYPVGMGYFATLSVDGTRINAPVPTIFLKKVKKRFYHVSREGE